MAREHLTELVHRTSRNHGIIDVEEIRSLGVTDRRRQHLVRTGLLERVVPGVYVLAGLPIDWERRLRIGLRQVAPDGAAAFFSAAHVWEFPGVGRGPIEVVVGTSSRRPSKPIGRLHRSEVLHRADIAVHRGLRVTTPARTLLDIATRLTADHLDSCLQDLARRGLATVDGVAAYLAKVRRRGLPGVRALDRVIERNSGMVLGESFLETEFLRLLGRSGLPEPEVQVELRVGDRTYRVDCLFPESHLVVELKGYGTHSTRAELTRDAAREADLLSLGLRVVSFTYDQVMGEPDRVLGRLVRLLRLDRSLGEAG